MLLPLYTSKDRQLRLNDFFWLIPIQPQDTDPLSMRKYQFHIQKQMSNHQHAALFATTLCVVGVFLFSILGNTSDSDASVVYEGKDRITLLSPALHVDPNPARGGSDLFIQDSIKLVAVNAADDSVFVPKTDQISLYTVREGDSLSHIADTFEVSINTIRWANDLSKSDVIAPGDQLVILPVSGIKHQVKKGDTLAKLAKKYESDALEIAAFNGLGEGDLKIGSEVIIPNGEIHTETPRAKGGGKTQVRTSVAQGSSGGYFSHPVPGARRSQGIHGRNAVDLAAPMGTPVYAAASGTVIISRSGGWNGGYGTYVVIRHGNGTQTLYSHLSGNSVSVGQWMTKGSRLGAVGNTGKSTGPHLHFEVRGGNNPF